MNTNEMNANKVALKLRRLGRVGQKYGNKTVLKNTLEKINDAKKGTVVSGGGYSFTKKGSNYWVNKNGRIFNDSSVNSFLAGFSDFKISKSVNYDIFNETDMDLQKAETILFGE